MKNRARWILYTALALTLALAACSPQAAPPEAETQEPTEEPTEEPATEEPTEEPTEAEPTTEEPAEVTNSVEVADQELAGDATVVVPSATSDTAGWMVIHADDGGAPGPVIGFTAVSADENADISVELDSEGVTETLYAMLHVDAGTEGEYEFPGDDVPARDAEGGVVVQPFSVTLPVANRVETTDQPLGEGNTVVVPGVTSVTAGWMVIHADDGGAPGPVIGFTPVEAGESTDVTVEIDAEAATDTLYAMLHVDAGTEGEYEFPGDDVPARDADDAVVVQPFALEASAAEEAEASATVTVANNRFTPAEITVAPGTTVTWTYNGSGAHTVAADDGSFASGNMGRGDSFSFTFEEPGEYPYYCQYHGGAGGLGMAGVVIVEAP